MVNSFLFALFMFFGLWGLCDFLYILRMLLLYPNTRIRNFSIIVLKKDCAVRQLNYIWQKIRWNGDSFSSGVIAITDYLDVNELLKCKKFAENKKIYLCTASTIVQCKTLQGELFDEYR